MEHYQKQNQSWEKEIGELKKRRDSLQAELANTQAGITNQKHAAGGEMLLGRDAGSALDALTRDRARVEALEDAIEQAGDQIRKLEQQCQDNERAYGKEQFDKVAAEAFSLILVSIKRLEDARAAFRAVDAKYAELATIGHWTSIAGLSDAQKRIQIAYSVLKKNTHTSMNNQDGFSGLDIAQVLRDFPEILAQAGVKANP